MNTQAIGQAKAFWERKSKKVALLFELLADPDLTDIVSTLRNGTAPQKATSLLEAAVSTVPGGTGLREAIRAVYPALPAHFTATDLVEVLIDRGFKFGKRDAKDAVRDQLYELSQKEEITVLKEGKGGQQNEYRVGPP